MNDNQRPMDPLSASQFNQPALIRNQIVLNGVDRTQGEFFPNLAGDFLRVEGVDYPCRISFNNTDFDQSVPMLPGIMVNGRFSGLTLWHENLTGTTATFLRAVIAIGRSGPILEADSFGGFSALPIPTVSVTNTTTISRRDILVPYGARQMKIRTTNVWGNAASPGGLLLTVAALMANGVTEQINSITRNGLAYSVPFNVLDVEMLSPIAYGAAQWAHSYESIVDIPTQAERIAVTGTLGAAATSNDLVYVLGFAR